MKRGHSATPSPSRGLGSTRNTRRPYHRSTVHAEGQSTTCSSAQRLTETVGRGYLVVLASNRRHAETDASTPTHTGGQYSELADSHHSRSRHESGTRKLNHKDNSYAGGRSKLTVWSPTRRPKSELGLCDHLGSLSERWLVVRPSLRGRPEPRTICRTFRLCISCPNKRHGPRLVAIGRRAAVGRRRGWRDRARLVTVLVVLPVIRLRVLMSLLLSIAHYSFPFQLGPQPRGFRLHLIDPHQWVGLHEWPNQFDGPEQAWSRKRGSSGERSTLKRVRFSTRHAQFHAPEIRRPQVDQNGDACEREGPTQARTHRRSACRGSPLRVAPFFAPQP